MNMINHKEIAEEVNALLARQDGVHISWFMPIEWEPGNVSARICSCRIMVAWLPSKPESV